MKKIWEGIVKFVKKNPKKSITIGLTVVSFIAKAFSVPGIQEPATGIIKVIVFIVGLL